MLGLPFNAYAVGVVMDSSDGSASDRIMMEVGMCRRDDRLVHRSRNGVVCLLFDVVVRDVCQIMSDAR